MLFLGGKLDEAAELLNAADDSIIMEVGSKRSEREVL
jgi:hypothetical protein